MKQRLRILTAAIGLAIVAVTPLASPCHAGIIILGPPIASGGYLFTNFDFVPAGGTDTGSNANGISNSGVTTGFTIVNGAAGVNFTANPLTGTSSPLTAVDNAGQMAFGINSAGDVVGGNGTSAFFLPNGGSFQPLTTPANAINAFGINDNGNIVGQFVSGNNTPGFILNSPTSANFTTINQPAGVTSDVINAQGINNNGLVVGFYLGNDGQVHGFTAQTPATPSTITATAVTDPTIPTNPNEPNATFVFSQILGINDNGLAVGYFGDSTTSQHGYFYNTTTGKYTFLDNPAAAFHNGVEVTQITGITNTGEISGFYTDANGTFHSFVADPTPEPASLTLFGIGLAGLAGYGWRRRKLAV